MNTRKLYYEDSHLSQFSARVTHCEQTEKGYEILLDATAFYPEGGGQAADTGTLGMVRVLDVRERDGQLVHLCSGPLEPGSVVEGRIDYDARFIRMQQHTGEHIVSGIIHRRHGYHNTGFHMNLERIVIDFDGVISPEELARIELEANEAIWRNIPLHIWTPGPEELARLSYRTKRALPWPVRIVEIPGYDICACCGTHVAATGEIGLIKLLSVIPFRGGVRMEMVCGRPAFELMNTVFDQNRQVSRVFSAQITQTGDAARQFADQLAAQKYRVVQLERQMFSITAESLRGRGSLVYFADGLTPGSLRELADAVAETCGGTAALFSGEDGSWNYCLAAREGDLRQLGRDMTAALHGRGGGKANFQQGKVSASRAEILDFFHAHGFALPPIETDTGTRWP